MCETCVVTVGSINSIAAPPLDGLISCGAYANPVLRSVVTRLKYHAAWCLSDAIILLLRHKRNILRTPWPWAGESRLTTIAIPSETRHARARGIQHTTIIEQAVREILVPWATPSSILLRVGRSLPNATLPADASRIANVHGTFRVTQSMTGAVLLIDDVWTTGATAREAVRVLKEAGAESVYALTLAQG